jgi:radical SAM protein with 4Fe4S-binding SPASM domain
VSKVTGLSYGIIEVTSKCQLRCPGCYMVQRHALNKGEMTLEQAIKILDFCRDYCGRDLETMDILGGEPLLWKPLKKYIEELLRRGIKPWIFTNMIAITPGLASWLFERQVHVTGKLNIDPMCGGPDKGPLSEWGEWGLNLQSYAIGGSRPMAAKLFEGLHVFMSVGYRDPLFRVQNLIRLETKNGISEYYEWCLRNNIGTDLELMGNGEGVSPKSCTTVDRFTLLGIIADIQEIRAEHNLPPAEVLMPHLFGACPFYDKGLYFAVDGTIRACSNSVVTLANINDTDSIRKAYESPLICNRLKLTRETVTGPCSTCHKWEKCRGGCRATVEGLGDPFGSYPLCPVPLL